MIQFPAEQWLEEPYRDPVGDCLSLLAVSDTQIKVCPVASEINVCPVFADAAYDGRVHACSNTTRDETNPATRPTTVLCQSSVPGACSFGFRRAMGLSWQMLIVWGEEGAGTI